MKISFPKKSLSGSFIKQKIQQAYEDTIDFKNGFILGYPGSPPLKQPSKSFKKFVDLHSNNIGTHTRTESEAGWKGTQDLERESIFMLADLFGLDDTDKVDGYISSGGSEGNIMGLWILRNLAEAKNKCQPCVLMTNLTHYSVKKATNLLRLNHEIVDCNNNYQIDTESLRNKIVELAKRGEKTIVIVATLGYTVTGSYDNLDEINKLADALGNQFGINVLIHVDAAHGGFILPFFDKTSVPFAYKHVQTLALDAHKTGLLPYSCGVFLCRKNLQAFIETEAGYLHSHFDDTLIGSRSGAIAAGLWHALSLLGSKGYRVIYDSCFDQKEIFLKQLSATKIPYWSYSHEYSNIVALQLTSLPNNQLPGEIENKYGLNLAKIENNVGSRQVYKLIFMPHVKKRIINSLIADIISAHQNL